MKIKKVKGKRQHIDTPNLSKTKKSITANRNTQKMKTQKQQDQKDLQKLLQNERQKRKQAEEKLKTIEKQTAKDISYQLKDQFLTRKEVYFYKELSKLIATEYNDRYQLILKPKLSSIVTTTKNSSEGRTAWNKIKSKHVDFVLLDSNNQPVLAIESNDSSHNRADRKNRDKFVKKVLDTIGLGIVFSRDFKNLKTQIEPYLS